MLVSQLFDEVRVYGGVAERTGVQVDRGTVRRSARVCRSISELARKARNSGDGYFYLPFDIWPAGIERVELHKKWVVVSS
jgi:hypothetical protein